MSECKDIVLNGQVIGNCIITKEGLYYRFQCNCQFDDRGVHKLFIKMNRNIFPLGICIPMGDKFILNKRIPIAQIGDAISSIIADDTRSSCQPNDLSRLQNAFLDSKG